MNEVLVIADLWLWTQVVQLPPRFLSRAWVPDTKTLPCAAEFPREVTPNGWELRQASERHEIWWFQVSYTISSTTSPTIFEYNMLRCSYGSRGQGWLLLAAVPSCCRWYCVSPFIISYLRYIMIYIPMDPSTFLGSIWGIIYYYNLETFLYLLRQWPWIHRVMPIYTHNQWVGTNLLYPLLSFCICRTIPRLGKLARSTSIFSRFPPAFTTCTIAKMVDGWTFGFIEDIYINHIASGYD